MNLLLLFLLLLLLVAAVAAVFLYFRTKAFEKSLSGCSNAIQAIFKLLEETSSVTRILSQEPPEQELKRLQSLIHKRNQKTMIENESLRGVIHGFPNGIVAVNADLDVVICNPAFCRLMNVPEAGHGGKKLFEVLRYHAALQAAEDFFRQENKAVFEIEFLDQSEKWIQLTMIRILNVRGVTALFVLTDISSIKRLENMRRDFVANVSHELRTPLTSIQGFVETLLDGASDDDSARFHFLGLMRKDTERLARLIEDLLVLSKIENPSQIFKKEKLSVTKELKEVLELFRLRFDQKKISFQDEIESDSEVQAHRDQFRQVLINLLDNSVKFTPENGKITLIARKAGNAGIEIRITDSGQGIQPENRDKVFQRFFREDKARSRDTGGTGLGLSIVKHIMEAHHGSVRCESGEQGIGTSFILFFPLA
ncbi:MAG TPA: ATP-binding protein [Candidatus Omnitrophota bacterium]|nr:ATP-binding protein [Candidatus Omnitrophota bacterium]